MKKYSKGKLKFRRFFIVLAVLLVVILILGLILLFAFCLNDSFDIISGETSNASNVSDDVAQNSQPIVVDNLVVGATYETTWVSASKYYLKSNNKTDVDTYVYTKDERAGQYTISDVYTAGDSIFVNTSYVNYVDEYFSIPTDTYALSSQFSETSTTESDYSYVKKALGIYRLYNSSINIKNVYSGYIDVDNPVRIITVTSSESGAFGGVYSCIIVAYVNENKAKILQYSYTKDMDNTSDFPLYSVEFFVDLNGDGTSEIVTRQVTEFSVTYNVFEWQDKKFVKVLSETMDIES